MIRMIRTATAAAAFGALCSPVLADDLRDGTMAAVYSDGARAETAVRFGDLDLSREVDARALYERLERAAESVCADARRVASPLAAQMARSCADRSLDRAVSTIGSELLLRLHNG